LRFVGGKFRAVKTGPGKGEDDVIARGACLIVFVRVLIPLRRANRRGIAGAVLGEYSAGGHQPYPQPAQESGRQEMRIPMGLKWQGIMHCTRHVPIYTPPPVKLNRKVGAAFFILAILVGGCSGINSSHSISPATFLLPGLLKADPGPVDSTAPLPEVETALQVAAVP